MTAIQRRKYLRRVSKQRAKDNKVYLAIRKEYLAMNPICQCCDRRFSTDIHHKAGRGRNFLAVDTFMAVCRFCHTQIHENPGFSRKMGYLV